MSNPAASGKFIKSLLTLKIQNTTFAAKLF